MGSDGVLLALEQHCLSNDPEFHARLVSLLARVGLYAPSRSELILYRAQAARRMMTWMSRSEVRDALQGRFGVSRRSAYRLIHMALKEKTA